MLSTMFFLQSLKWLIKTILTTGIKTIVRIAVYAGVGVGLYYLIQQNYLGRQRLEELKEGKYIPGNSTGNTHSQTGLFYVTSSNGIEQKIEEKTKIQIVPPMPKILQQPKY